MSGDTMLAKVSSKNPVVKWDLRNNHPRASLTVRSVCPPKHNSATARRVPCALVGNAGLEQSSHHSARVRAPKSSVSGNPYIWGCWPIIADITEEKERGTASMKTGELTCPSSELKRRSFGSDSREPTLSNV